MDSPYNSLKLLIKLGKASSLLTCLYTMFFFPTWFHDYIHTVLRCVSSNLISSDQNMKQDETNYAYNVLFLFFRPHSSLCNAHILLSPFFLLTFLPLSLLQFNSPSSHRILALHKTVCCWPIFPSHPSLLFPPPLFPLLVFRPAHQGFTRTFSENVSL